MLGNSSWTKIFNGWLPNGQDRAAMPEAEPSWGQRIGVPEGFPRIYVPSPTTIARLRRDQVGRKVWMLPSDLDKCK